MKLAKVMGKMVASKTSTLDGIVLTVGIGSNLHSDKVEEAAQSFLGNWKSGGDAVTVMFSASTNSGFMEIDGQVLIDGKPMDYVTLGPLSRWIFPRTWSWNCPCPRAWRDRWASTCPSRRRW